MRANRHAFTLIELLVVITIIMVLVALIYPAASGVVRMAQETQCQNHLNQLGQITVTYCQARSGRFPPPCDKTVMGTAYTSSWVVSGTTSRNTWIVDSSIFYRDKLIGDLSILWCPVHVDEWNIYRPTAVTIYWRTDITGHSNRSRIWTSYMMNGNVYYDPSNPSAGTNRTESRLSSEFTANHFLFMEEHETKGRFDDGIMLEDDARTKITERHEGYGFVACMDGHVIKMTESEFDATKISDQKKYYWTPR